MNITAQGIRSASAHLVQRGALSVADYRRHVEVLLDLECTLRMWSAIAIKILSGTDTACEPWCYRLGDRNAWRRRRQRKMLRRRGGRCFIMGGWAGGRTEIHYPSMPDFLPVSCPLGVVPSGLERGHLTQAGLNREATVSRILATSTSTSPAGSSTSTLASRFGQST